MASQDEFHRHEVLHTASIMMQMFEDHICSTQYVESNPDVQEAAQRTFDALFDFYQLVGARTLDAGHDLAKDSAQQQSMD